MATSNGGLRNMTEGSPARHIVLFALPLLAGNFLQQFYNMVDSWVVGNYVSDGALAAVGVGFPVIFLFTSLFSGIATGGTVVIAQFYGAGKLDRVRDAVDTIYTAFVWAAVPVTLMVAVRAGSSRTAAKFRRMRAGSVDRMTEPGPNRIASPGISVRTSKAGQAV